MRKLARKAVAGLAEARETARPLVAADTLAGLDRTLAALESALGAVATGLVLAERAEAARAEAVALAQALEMERIDDEEAAIALLLAA